MSMGFSFTEEIGVRRKKTYNDESRHKRPEVWKIVILSFQLIKQRKFQSSHPSSKTPRTNWVSVMKSPPQLIDVLVQDDAFQENEDVKEGSSIDAMIEDVGPLVHESCSSEELDIVVETYLVHEEAENDETEIKWDSDEDADEDSDTQNIV
ncbi:hypothetical protein M9H77_29736 [Catharanthus roseus]|uniref:Uncharacterized protein n=1 Tax=Catharanthus roseus TaxID=4058 RepID=A0ACB9ZW21_CATRO|nr:hypothetical protein M9H77_29736 [Catharanthus roseus]